MKVFIAFFVLIVVAFAGIVVATGDLVYPPISAGDNDEGTQYQSKIVDWLK